ncbi:MAG TPA: NAD-dependent deacylase [Caulobacteraceae bacterium]|jgi:NAD-dependent deacetylase|nr:NAD-dependent deacylase [Caulobacteraceae bacterium]
MTEKIVVFTGAGVSQESGLRTFRDMGGLWQEYSIEEVASPQGFAKNPALVLDFYNVRRRKLREVEPNAAHLAIAELERAFEVVVVTQNVDDLHERAGSTNVIHIHGEILMNRSSVDPTLRYPAGDKVEIELGDLCEKGGQLRPDVVWFGEDVLHFEASERHFREADKVLVVGTSLTVFPAAGLVRRAPYEAEKVVVSLDLDEVPRGFRFLRGKATEVVPSLVTDWMR